MEYKFEWMLSNARSAVLARRLAEADTTKRGWQKAIAEELGVSKQYVSQVYKRFKEEQEMGGRGGGSGRGGGAVGGGSVRTTKDGMPFGYKKSQDAFMGGFKGSGWSDEAKKEGFVLKEKYDGWIRKDPIAAEKAIAKDQAAVEVRLNEMSAKRASAYGKGVKAVREYDRQLDLIHAQMHVGRDILGTLRDALKRR